ncbi:hypothetical protein [Pseudogemmobacter faecipullorum]|uniref:Uncharacterized protein n=1 Tax=Pseudogemmobacter faecipullorum TaxID=2755041 RepID=A0ABS8CPL6_9RHOB|nr:hypothetical protein [Pseudogemmobacter faecipullorum]MCB5411314.1 hypothetical protein [Pseudogemmobacter faecipullorum]
MSKVEFAEVEFRPHFSGHISAWCQGKYLGYVLADGETVSVVLCLKVLSLSGRSVRSEANKCVHPEHARTA